MDTEALARSTLGGARQLCELMRPHTWEEVVGQDRAIARLKQAATFGGWGGKVYALTGASGTGKTTIARLIAAELADPWCTEELNGQDVTAEDLRRWEAGMFLGGLGQRGGRCIVINEFHGLRAAIVRAMLTLLEPTGGLPARWAMVLTTTADGLELFEDEHLDASPLMSRCTVKVKLTNQGLVEAMAPVLQAGAAEYGLNGQGLGAYKKLMNRVKNNMRDAWQEIQSGAMLGNNPAA